MSGDVRFLPLPLGRQSLVIQGVQGSKAPSGSERLTFIFGGVGDTSEMRACEDVYLTDSALWKLSEICIACGLRVAIPIGNIDALNKMFNGKRLSGEVYDHDWKGHTTTTTRRRVRRFQQEEEA